MVCVCGKCVHLNTTWQSAWYPLQFCLDKKAVVLFHRSAHQKHVCPDTVPEAGKVKSTARSRGPDMYMYVYMYTYMCVHVYMYM